jgi:hypothetical protein
MLGAGARNRYARLLDATRAEGEAAGLDVLPASGAEPKRELAFGVVRQQLQPAIERGACALVA